MSYAPGIRGEPECDLTCIAGARGAVPEVTGEYAGDARPKGVTGDADAVVRPGVGVKLSRGCSCMLLWSEGRPPWTSSIESIYHS